MKKSHYRKSRTPWASPGQRSGRCSADTKVSPILWHQGHSQSPGAWLCHPGGFPISIPGREHHTGQYCSCRLQTGNLTFLDDHHSPNCKGILGTQREPCLHIPSDFGRSVISSAGKPYKRKCSWHHCPERV